MLTEYTIDVFRELDESVADEDIYLDEFRDEIDGWVIDAIKAIGHRYSEGCVECSSWDVDWKDGLGRRDGGRGNTHFEIGVWRKWELKIESWELGVKEIHTHSTLNSQFSTLNFLKLHLFIKFKYDDKVKQSYKRFERRNRDGSWVPAKRKGIP